MGNVLVVAEFSDGKFRLTGMQRVGATLDQLTYLHRDLDISRLHELQMELVMDPGSSRANGGSCLSNASLDRAGLVEHGHHPSLHGVDGQQPLLGSLKGAGHALGGSYIFRLKDAAPLGSDGVGVASLQADPLRNPSRMTAPPPGRVRDLESEIGEVLEGWRQAYETLDFSALRQIWPDCPWTPRTFGKASGFEIEMPAKCEIDGTGTRASADCRIRITPVGRKKQWREYGARFDLENRAGAGWKILTHTASE